ncbi:MAG: cytochrome c oxidase assembly protein [Edaphobacter sp.]
MAADIQSTIASWEPSYWISASVLFAAVVYCRGWLAIRKTRSAQFPLWRLNVFLLAMAILWIAIGSPLDAFADAMLSAHMIEHLLLMSVVPPLVLLANPTVPLLRGLPRWSLKHLLGPLIRIRPLRNFTHWLIRPRIAWLIMNLIFLGWHVPAAYDFALEHEGWHVVEHLCFLFASILFWWPIIRPWPTGRRIHTWGLILYLLSADVINTALSAFLAFCTRPMYPYYLTEPNPFHLSPLSDQVIGAVIMWVFGSLVFLVPAMFITIKLIQPDHIRLPDREYDI